MHDNFADPSAPSGEVIETQVTVEDALGQLPARYQAILALRASGYTQAEIGGILEIARTNVWSEEHEAIDLVRKILANYRL